MSRQEQVHIALKCVTDLLKGKDITTDTAMLTVIAQNLITINATLADIRDELSWRKDV